MAFRNIRPLHVLWQEGITEEMLEGVKDGIRTTLALAGVSGEIAILYYGQRGKSDWLEQRELINPYDNLGWHLWYAQEKSEVPDHLNSIALLNSLADNPGYEAEPRYELVVVKNPIHSGNNPNLFGVGRHNQGAIVTLGDKLCLLDPVDKETDSEKRKRLYYYHLHTRLNTMHELGHVWGLCTRQEAHCQNDCVMWWQENPELYNKIKNWAFCPECLVKLKQYFIFIAP